MFWHIFLLQCLQFLLTSCTDEISSNQRLSGKRMPRPPKRTTLQEQLVSIRYGGEAGDMLMQGVRVCVLIHSPSKHLRPHCTDSDGVCALTHTIQLMCV